MILLDTNVLSEMMHLKPEPAVLAWIDAQRSNELWTCTIVIAEIFAGLELMPAGKRAIQLRERTEAMLTGLFAGRIFPLNEPAARAYGSILRMRRSLGRPVDEMDALIAATALAHGATLATRNTSHFENCGISLVDPWQSQSA